MAGRPLRRARLALVKEGTVTPTPEVTSEPTPAAPPRGRPERYTALEVAKVLTETRGMVAMAARHLGCSGRQLRRYVEKYEVCQVAVHEARELQADKTEAKIFDAIDRGESWAITLYAQTQMRHRGYGKQAPGPMRASEGVVKSGEPILTPRSLTIDYDAYNKAYEEAMSVIHGPREDRDADAS